MIASLLLCLPAASRSQSSGVSPISATNFLAISRTWTMLEPLSDKIHKHTQNEKKADNNRQQPCDLLSYALVGNARIGQIER